MAVLAVPSARCLAGENDAGAKAIVPQGAAPQAAVAQATLARAKEAGWAQWRGPRRDGASEETGLLQSWPEKGPALLWTASDQGRGYSSPIVVGDTVYATGDVGEDLEIRALDLNGAVRWRAKNGARWKQPWPGARAGCSYDAGRVYHMNAHGRVVCLEAGTGKEAWSANVLERFEARNVTWGQSESVLIDGRRAIVTVAGAKALVAALDKETGQTVWASPALEGEKTSYTSPILVTMGDRRLLVNTGSRHTFGVDADTGKLLWAHRHPIPDNTLGATPILLSDSVFITNSSRDASVMYRLRLGADGTGVEQVWSRVVKNGQGGMVHAAGRLYGGNGLEGEDGIVAVDPETGTISKIVSDLSFGSAAYADGRIYYLSQKGEMALLRPTDAGAEIVGRFRLVEARQKDAWAHPVVCRGRLFLRYHETLFCYDVRRS